MNWLTRYAVITKIIIAFAITFSCKPVKKNTTSWTPFYQNQNADIFEELILLKSEDTISFGLDERTAFESFSLNYQETDRNEYFFSFTNHLDNKLLIYNYLDRKKPTHITNLQLKDSNLNIEWSRGHNHLLLNRDSIFIYNTNTAKLYLIDWEGEIIHQTQLLELSSSTSKSGRPRMNSTSRMFIKDDFLYIPCEFNAVLENYNSHNLVVRYHIKTHEFSYKIPASTYYNYAHWGPLFNYRINICQHPSKNSILYGFPIDPFVYEKMMSHLDSNHHISTFVGSTKFEKIEPMNYDPNYATQKEIHTIDKERREYGWSTSGFYGLVSDSHHNLIYRIAYVRHNTLSFKKGFDAPHLSIIVLNEDLMKVGELNLNPEIYDLDMLFINKIGLHIARKDHYKNNNKLLTFEVFKPTSVN
jgi:hypothetical protein